MKEKEELAEVVGSVILNSWKVKTKNPEETLKTEEINCLKLLYKIIEELAEIKNILKSLE